MTEKPLVSIIVPSREERFLNNTVNDILQKATGNIEVFVILDGYEIPDNEIIKDERVIYIKLPRSNMMTKRVGINTAVKQAKGDFVMASDAHCMFGKGFDEILARDCGDNMIMLPRRYKLDPIKWDIMPGWAPWDYEYWIWRSIRDRKIMKNYNWHERREARKDIMIDDTLTIQASCWFMKKSYYEKMGFMRCEGYTPWGQEDVELCMECHTNGGRVLVNKNTWYAHLFKGKTYGRMYKANLEQHAKSRAWAYNHWIIENRDKFKQVIDKFWPIPNWPDNWEEKLYGKSI